MLKRAAKAYSLPCLAPAISSASLFSLFSFREILPLSLPPWIPVSSISCVCICNLLVVFLVSARAVLSSSQQRGRKSRLVVFFRSDFISGLRAQFRRNVPESLAELPI